MMADKAATRYTYLLNEIRSVYTSCVFDVVEKRLSVQKVKDSVSLMGDEYIEQEVLLILEDMNYIGSLAYSTTLNEMGITRDTPLPENIKLHIEETSRHLLEEVDIQMSRDTISMITALRRSLVFSRKFRSKAEKDFEFQFIDRKNRKYPSVKYVRTLYRHNLQTIYNDVVMLTLKSYGITIAEVRHQDPKSKKNYIQVSLDDNENYVLYEDARDVIFHPNSGSFLVAPEISNAI